MGGHVLGGARISGHLHGRNHLAEPATVGDKSSVIGTICSALAYYSIRTTS